MGATALAPAALETAGASAGQRVHANSLLASVCSSARVGSIARCSKPRGEVALARHSFAVLGGPFVAARERRSCGESVLLIEGGHERSEERSQSKPKRGARAAGPLGICVGGPSDELLRERTHCPVQILVFLMRGSGGATPVCF
jgi:hypothetical protein